MKFRIVKGKHWFRPKGQRKPVCFKEGSVIESHVDLDKLFNAPKTEHTDPLKYELVPDSTPAVGSIDPDAPYPYQSVAAATAPDAGGGTATLAPPQLGVQGLDRLSLAELKDLAEREDIDLGDADRRSRESVLDAIRAAVG